MSAPEFDQMVFAGGGNRCWWRAGWWDVVQPELGLASRVVVGISAGAPTACMLHAWNSAELMDHYGEALHQNTRNARWGNLLRGERVFPHCGMCRTALLTIFSEGRFRRLAQAPEIRIGVAHIPRWLGARSAVAVGLIAYSIEKHIRKTLHSTLDKRLGFTVEIVCMQGCATPEDLADLLLQSVSTLPFTSVLRRAGRPVLDDGMVDNVPVHALDAIPGDALILVTRLYPRPTYFRMDVPVSDGVQHRFYVQPSCKVPISSWGYTRPGAMRDAYALGRHDDETFLCELPRGLTTVVAA